MTAAATATRAGRPVVRRPGPPPGPWRRRWIRSSALAKAAQRSSTDYFAAASAAAARCRSTCRAPRSSSASGARCKASRRAHQHLWRGSRGGRFTRRPCGRRGDRPQPGVDPRALPPRAGPGRLADRLCRRPAAQAGAAAPRRRLPSPPHEDARPDRPAAAGRDLGRSFLFMRLAAPAFGPVALAFVRVTGAALCCCRCCAAREWPVLRRHWRPIGWWRQQLGAALHAVRLSRRYTFRPGWRRSSTPPRRCSPR